MAIIVFLMGLILFIAGAGSLMACLDLLPTELGMLYAVCGAVALSSALIVFSIAALIRRLDTFGRPRRKRPGEPNRAREEPSIELAPHVEAEAIARVAPEALASGPVEEEPLNENRSGRLPTLHEVEAAIAHPEDPPTLVGRYSAGGANYMIFSDGTIEAETDQGAYRFASMGDFKAFIAGRQA